MRDMSAEWAAVFAAAYMDEYGYATTRLSERAVGDEARDEIATYAAGVADEAIAALHRVRGEEPAT